MAILNNFIPHNNKQKFTQLQLKNKKEVEQLKHLRSAIAILEDNDHDTKNLRQELTKLERLEKTNLSTRKKMFSLADFNSDTTNQKKKIQEALFNVAKQNKKKKEQNQLVDIIASKIENASKNTPNSMRNHIPLRRQMGAEESLNMSGLLSKYSQRPKQLSRVEQAKAKIDYAEDRALVIRRQRVLDERWDKYIEFLDTKFDELTEKIEDVASCCDGGGGGTPFLGGGGKDKNRRGGKNRGRGRGGLRNFGRGLGRGLGGLVRVLGRISSQLALYGYASGAFDNIFKGKPQTVAEPAAHRQSKFRGVAEAYRQSKITKPISISDLASEDAKAARTRLSATRSKPIYISDLTSEDARGSRKGTGKGSRIQPLMDLISEDAKAARKGTGGPKTPLAIISDLT